MTSPPDRQEGIGTRTVLTIVVGAAVIIVVGVAITQATAPQLWRWVWIPAVIFTWAVLWYRLRQIRRQP